MFPVRSNALQLIPVDEYRDQGVTVVRAEIPGIDPARDVEVFVCDGLLRIKAERRDKAVFGERTYIRKEIRSGSLLRVLPMPSGVKASDVTSTYTDGILEVRIGGPAPAPSSQ
jgi:HSP20 family protein